MKLMKYLGIAGLFSVSAFAADPAWYTDLTTQLGTIQTMVAATLGLVITIALSPLAWNYVRRVINRG